MDILFSNQSSNIEVHTLFLTLNILSYNLPTEWDPGVKTWKPPANTMVDFKPCGNFKARLVVDGNLTKQPTEIVHSAVVSLRSLRLAMFTAEPNDFQLWGADDEYAYLQALIKEKLCIVPGPESSRVTRTCYCYVQGTLWCKTWRSMLA